MKYNKQGAAFPEGTRRMDERNLLLLGCSGIDRPDQAGTVRDAEYRAHHRERDLADYAREHSSTPFVLRDHSELSEGSSILLCRPIDNRKAPRSKAHGVLV